MQSLRVGESGLESTLRLVSHIFCSILDITNHLKRIRVDEWLGCKVGHGHRTSAILRGVLALGSFSAIHNSSDVSRVFIASLIPMTGVDRISAKFYLHPCTRSSDLFVRSAAWLLDK